MTSPHKFLIFLLFLLLLLLSTSTTSGFPASFLITTRKGERTLGILADMLRITHIGGNSKSYDRDGKAVRTVQSLSGKLELDLEESLSPSRKLEGERPIASNEPDVEESPAPSKERIEESSGTSPSPNSRASALPSSNPDRNRPRPSPESEGKISPSPSTKSGAEEPETSPALGGTPSSSLPSRKTGDNKPDKSPKAGEETSPSPSQETMVRETGSGTNDGEPEPSTEAMPENKENLAAGESMPKEKVGPEEEQTLQAEEAQDKKRIKKESKLKRKKKRKNDRRDAMTEINAFRKQYKRTELILDIPLTKVAGRHSRKMAQTGQVFHRDNIFEIKSKLRAKKIGENVGHQILEGTDQNLGFEIVQSWKNSPTHRATMLDKAFTHAGFNCHIGQYGPNVGPFCTLMVTRYKPTKTVVGDGGNVLTIDPVII